MNLRSAWFTISLMPKSLKAFGSYQRSLLLNQSGQTAIFVFVLLLVGLTIGLSLAGRTFRDFQSSGSSDFSSRAFSAAEAGGEGGLRQDLFAAASWAYGATSPAAARFGYPNQ